MYEYKPLDRNRKEIRLLILEPDSGDSILSCKLRHEFLDSPALPLYETISYVCGDQEVKTMIKLHNCEVRIPATSEAALRCMRLGDRSRILWIDAICIDATNVEERGHQVGMMHALYSQTSRNLIYLGPDDSMMTHFTATVEKTLREISLETENYDSFAKMLSPRDPGTHSLDDPFGFGILKSGLGPFFSNSWFSRLWVVQEASLSQTSICYIGKCSLPLIKVLRTAIWLYMRLNWSRTSGINSRENDMLRAAVMFDFADKTYGRVFSRKMTWQSCLSLLHEFSAFDRRDQVFAVIGLWQKHTKAAALPPALKPDYTLSVTEVFTNATKFAIQEHDDLLILRSVSVSQRKKEHEGWPSWVPVLDYRSQASFRPNSLRVDSQADNRYRTRLLSSVAGMNTLDLGGILIDKVVDVAIAMPYTPRERDDEVIAMENLFESMEMSRPKHSWVESLGGDNEAIAGLTYRMSRSRRVPWMALV